MSDEVKLLPCEGHELKSCPFCRQELEVVESWAKAFAPPRLYREYHHRASGCVLGRLDWTFPDLAEEKRQAFIAAWNTRAIEATRPTEQSLSVPFGPGHSRAEPEEVSVVPTSVPNAAFQQRVGDWVAACFPALAARDKLERSDRFIEEALETVQAAGYSPDRAHALVDYVFSRPAGALGQEVGGSMTTLAALCNAHGLDMDSSAETELARVWTKIDVIRAKQAAKPTGSALPIAASGTPTRRAETPGSVSEADGGPARRETPMNKLTNQSNSTQDTGR